MTNIFVCPICVRPYIRNLNMSLKEAKGLLVQNEEQDRC
jgi:hypothetical protein